MGECTDSEMDQYRTASAPLYANEDELDAKEKERARSGRFGQHNPAQTQGQRR